MRRAGLFDFRSCNSMLTALWQFVYRSRKCGRVHISRRERSPRVRHCVVLYVVTFIILIPLSMFHLKYSLLYPVMLNWGKVETGDVKGLWIEESERRFELARNFLKDFHRVKYNRLSSERKASLCTTIITTERKNYDGYKPTGYLTQSVESLLRAEADFARENFQLQLHLCDVTASAFENAEFKSVKRFADHISALNEFATDTSSLGANANQRGLNISSIAKKSFEAVAHMRSMPKRKECFDYAFCIARAMLLCNDDDADWRDHVDPSSTQYFNKYLLVLEDDAVLTRGGFGKLDHILYRLHKLIPSHHDSDESAIAESVGFLKMYHPVRLTGYFSGFEPDRIPELLALSLFAGLALTYLYCRVFESSRAIPMILNYSKSWRVLLTMTIYSFLVMAVVGRHTFAEPIRALFSWSHLLVSPAPTCCTPAMLYPRVHGDALIEHLFATCSKESAQEASYSKDLLIDNLMRSNGLSTHYVYPSLFEHIGMLTTLGQMSLHPYVLA